MVLMSNRCASPFSEAAPQNTSPSTSPVPGMAPQDLGRQPKRPSSSPGKTGVAKWKHPARRGKSPYSMTVGTPRKWIPGHAVTGDRSWDWRPKSPESKEKLPQLENLQKIRDERAQEDLHWDKTVSSYLNQSTSVYTLVNERDEMAQQLRHLVELVPRLESEYEQADRAALERLSVKHDAALDEKQRQLSKVETSLITVEKELDLARVRVQDADTMTNELKANIVDLRDFKDRSIENEKLMQGQIQDLTQRRERLEQELKENLKIQQETETQLKAARDDNLAKEREHVRQQQQHAEALQRQREEADRERQRRDAQEADLRQRSQKEVADLRKDLETHRTDSQNQQQQAAAQAAQERAIHQEQTQAASARYSKDVGDLRTEVQSEKIATQKITAEFNEQQKKITEQEKLKEKLDLLQQELAEERNSKAQLVTEEKQQAELLQSIKEDLIYENDECRMAKSETEAAMQEAEKLHETCLQVEAMYEEGQRRVDAAEQQVRALQEKQASPKQRASPVQDTETRSNSGSFAMKEQQLKAGIKNHIAQPQAQPAEARKETPPVTEREERQTPKQVASTPNKVEESAPEPKPVVKAAKPVKKIERAGCVFWQVELKKSHPSDSYGFTQISGKEWKLDIEAGPEHWLVKRIMNPGLLYHWNQEHPECPVIPTDRIVAVNEFTTLAEMQEAQQESQIKMTICRFPETFELQLQKNGQKLGFMFEKPGPDDQAEIRITKVLQEGALPASNRKEIKSLRWHRVVLPEMCITAVNDVEGDATRLGEELRVCETVRLRIRRPQELAKDLQSRRSVLIGQQGQVNDDSENAAAPAPEAPQQEQKTYW
eukprot:gnl/MRDRNA2_/MRDRNA2_101528_c0_seq1.p1 gnl/MRDRNA2_/MRDRNA2_101528_c0~~gnl/MRDRNA2_/MRDRNA2_101528_c0_seq1.p1  ORF type:complete len:833 (+),score=246.65 gnl/MRDRNA2_/MRDRNA2_101528_c0_seq1:139-2637(+)